MGSRSEIIEEKYENQVKELRFQLEKLKKDSETLARARAVLAENKPLIKTLKTRQMYVGFFPSVFETFLLNLIDAIGGAEHE